MKFNMIATQSLLHLTWADFFYCLFEFKWTSSLKMIQDPPFTIQKEFQFCLMEWSQLKQVFLSYEELACSN